MLLANNNVECSKNVHSLFVVSISSCVVTEVAIQEPYLPNAPLAELVSSSDCFRILSSGL